MAPIPDTLRQQVIERAEGRCEYCQTSMTIVVEMQIDHIIPQALNGSSELDNLCLACVGCNNFKLAFTEAEDPETGETVPIFHPRTQLWHDHFAWSDNSTLMIGKTPIGRATIVRLRMNREAVVRARRVWVAAGWHPPKT